MLYLCYDRAPLSHFPLINSIFFYKLYVFTALRYSFYHYEPRLGTGPTPALISVK